MKGGGQVGNSGPLIEVDNHGMGFGRLVWGGEGEIVYSRGHIYQSIFGRVHAFLGVYTFPQIYQTDLATKKLL